ncbi:hypothetical protein ACFPRL_02090 [Pseudoclavibacter helvolus]
MAQEAARYGEHDEQPEVAEPALRECETPATLAAHACPSTSSRGPAEIGEAATGKSRWRRNPSK